MRTQGTGKGGSSSGGGGRGSSSIDGDDYDADERLPLSLCRSLTEVCASFSIPVAVVVQRLCSAHQNHHRSARPSADGVDFIFFAPVHWLRLCLDS